MKSIKVLVAVVLALLLFASVAMATAAWMKTFKDTYKPKSGTELSKAGCAICHVEKNGKGGLNTYGKQLDGKKNDKESYKSIEKLDADKDGVKNIDEIKAGTLPGDAKSKPKNCCPND